MASGGHSSSRCAGLSLSRPHLLRSTGSRRTGSVIVAHRPSCSAACGIFPDQGSNPCPLHWQADSQPLCHQGSPSFFLFKTTLLKQLIYCRLKVYNFINFDLHIYLGNCHFNQDNKHIFHHKSFIVPLGNPSFLSPSLDNYHDYRLVCISRILCK